jgi:hypothetical protein
MKFDLFGMDKEVRLFFFIKTNVKTLLANEAKRL